MKQIIASASRLAPGNRFALVFVFCLAVLAVLWRFLQWMPAVFYGDDLDYLLLFKDGACATRASEILTTACYERFRPVASGFALAMMNLFGDRLPLYLTVNVALHALTATLVFAIAQRLTRGNWIASLALAAAVATSRLATYQVTQMIAPVESLALIASLAAIYAAVRADEDRPSAWRWSWVSILMVFFAIHTHERFLVMVVWLGGVFILSPSIRSIGPRRWIALFLACVALPIYYVSYKTFILDAHFLVGTGGTHLDPTTQTIAQFAGNALQSILGFNTGPDYLVGATVSRAWPQAWATATLFSLSLASVVSWGLYQAIRGKGTDAGPVWDRLRWPFLFLSLVAFLVVPALLTIRLEQRWLLAPFVVALLIPAWAAGTMRGAQRGFVTALIVILGLASTTLDGMVMQHYGKVFFISSPRFAEVVKRDVVDKYPLQSGGVALVAGADQCSWTLRQGGFFRIYGGEQRTLECFTSTTAAAAANLPPDTRIYGAVAPGDATLVDLTDEAHAALEASGGTPAFDFLQEFTKGHINDTTRVSTPTGQGVLVMSWESMGGTRDTLTIISGFSYRYDTVPVTADTQLRFEVGMIYPSAQSARAIVRINPEGDSPTILYSRDLTPPQPGAALRFMPVTLPLGDYAGQRISISFAVESPGGDSTGHWIAFANPRLVTDSLMQ